MRIIFLGSGNVAQIFAKRLFNSGHDILQIYSPTIANAKALAASVNAASTNDIKQIIPDADVYILAIKDNALAEVAAQLNSKEKVAIHCAGAVSLDVLQQVSEHRAVIWSLYSIQKNNFPQNNNMPLVVEANSSKALQTAVQLANDISNNVTVADLIQRQMLHLNAVLVNNFTNHLLTIAQNICNENNLPFDILLPIIKQTFEQTEKTLPSESQTGPAIRNDTTTISKHIELLSGHPLWQKIYEDISISIQQNATSK
jgi:pyrroline-5-carboxylate reductase